jgi:hypothetical protein
METSDRCIPVISQDATAKITSLELIASSTFVLPDSIMLHYSMEGIHLLIFPYFVL